MPSFAAGGQNQPGMFASKFRATSSSIIPAMSEDETSALTRKIYGQVSSANRELSTFEEIGNYAAATGLDLVDTVASSLPGPNLFIDRGDIWKMTDDYGGAIGSDLNAFYRNNQSAVEGLSGLTGAVATGYAAGALLLPRIASSMAASTAISSSRVWQMGATANAAIRSRLASAQATAVMRGEAFHALSGPGMSYFGLRAAQGIGTAAFEEAAIVLAMNQNQFIWSNDMGDNLFYSAIGLGIGGALGGIAGRAEMRRMMNDPAMINLRAQTTDPNGFSFLHENQPDLPSLQAMAANGDVGKESAVYTALRLGSRQEIPQGADPSLVAKLEQINQQGVEQSEKVLQKITVKGLSGVSNTGFSIENTRSYNFGQHLREASHDNPLLLFGADSVGNVSRVDPFTVRPKITDEVDSTDSVIQQARAAYKAGGQPGSKTASVTAFRAKASAPDVAKFKGEFDRLAKRDERWKKMMTEAQDSGSPLRAVMTARKIHIESLHVSGDPANVALARKLESQQPLMLVNRGWMPADTKEAFDFASYKPGKVAVAQPTGGVHDYTIKYSSGAKKSVNESLKTSVMHNLGERDWMETVEALDHVMKRMQRGGQTLVLGKNRTWSQLDALIEYERRGGVVDWKTQGGLNNTQEAQLESLRLKAQHVGTLGLAGFSGYWDRLRFNLPLPTNLERIYDPASDALRAVLDAARSGAPLADLIQLRTHMMKMHGLNVETPDVRLDGDMFQFNRTRHEREGLGVGEWMDTPIAYFDTSSSRPVFSSDQVAEQIAELKAERFNTLTHSPAGGEMVPGLVVAAVSMPEFRLAMNVRGLADDQVTGVGSFGTQLVGEAVTREFRYRDNIVMQAALRFRQTINKLTDSHIEKSIKQHMGDIVPRLSAAPASSSKVLVNQFYSNSQGWDLTGAITQVGATPGGAPLWGFEIGNTVKNQARIGGVVAQGDMLINPRTGQAMVVDDLGLEFIQRFTGLAETIRLDRNRIRKSLGLDPIAPRALYAPPWYTKNKYVAFTFDESNSPVPGGAIVADTESRFKELIDQRRRAGMPTGHKIWTREQIENTADIYDRAAMDFIDPGTGVAPAKGQTGTLAMDTVNPNAVGDILQWVKRQMESNATGSIRVLFDAQLGIARARSAVERGGSDAKASKTSHRSIFDEYEATILGRKLGDLQRSITGSVMKPLENFLDRGLEQVWPAMRFMAPSQWAQWYGDLADHVGLKTTRARTFHQLVDQLGPYTPYRSAVDYAEQTLKIVRPPEVKKISEGLNRLAASTLLRWFEIPHAAMNLIGVMTTMPSILQSGKSPVTAILQGTNGKRLRVLDTYRVLAESMHDMTRKSKHADWDYMQSMGYTKQQVADYNVLMSQIEDRSSFTRIMMGDPNRTGETLRDKMARKGVDGLVSAATDTTEEWSRAWSHFAGLRLADIQGIVGREARHQFAHEIANAAIANYNPLNRPEIYQSAFGSLAGLFMSWMQSYNQRLFRWMEDGDYAAMGHQLGMQAGMFGVASLPGYNQLESALMMAKVGETEEGREATIMDRIYARFGPMVGSAIAHGGLNQAHVVLYTRGDMNYRNVNFDPAQMAAGVSILSSYGKAFGELAQTLFTEHGIEGNNRVGEILARNMPNRMWKGILENIANGGQSIDANGRIVSENKTFFESSLRILGLRSSRQQSEIEAFYADKQQQAREAARVETFRLEVRNLMRKGKWEGKVGEIFEKYVGLGMRPEHFRTWLQGQIRETTSTRGMEELRKAFNDPTAQQSIWRYNAYGALD